MDDNQPSEGSSQGTQTSQPVTSVGQNQGLSSQPAAGVSSPAVSPGGKKYRIRVDRNLCIGAASCVALAAKTFALDSENKAIVIDDDGDLPEAIKLAAESCPTKAIILENIESGQQEYP